MTLCRFRNGILALLLSSGIYQVQAQTDNHIIPFPGELSQEALQAWKKKLPADGWFILRFKEGDRLFNFSNKDYEMSLWLNCNGTGKPGYLIEYSDHYGDGDYGGLDFISSEQDNGNRVQFTLDGKDFGDPFTKGSAPPAAFITALKSAKTLTISVYDKELNPETGRNEEKLDRSIEFRLAHGELLDKPVSCGE